VKRREIRSFNTRLTLFNIRPQLTHPNCFARVDRLVAEVKTKLLLLKRLLRIPLFYKILLANSAIVGRGAVAGTVITVWHVRSYPDDIHYELIAFFAIAGIVISFFVNRWVLKRTLEPLGRLQEAVDQVRRRRQCPSDFRQR